jgi:multidrug efflux pump subunit AcrA (membrane-fusion protein)
VFLPQEAIQTAPDGIGKFVLVVTPDGTAAKKTVTLGIANAQSAQVLSGVTPADNVITTGSYGLDEGARVKVGAPTAEGDKD